MLDELADRSLAVAEKVEDRLSARLAENLERRERRHRASIPFQLYSCQGMYRVGSPGRERVTSPLPPTPPRAVVAGHEDDAMATFARKEDVKPAVRGRHTR